jgi:hypothetical protein
MMRHIGVDLHNQPPQFAHPSPGIILVKQHKASFKWCHFEPTSILLCVRWYCS